MDKILNAAELKPSDVAFEIGPGTGGMRDAREKREWRERQMELKLVLQCMYSNCMYNHGQFC